MHNTNRNIRVYLIISAFALLLSGCAGSVKNMSELSPDKVSATPDKGKARVVFMRPSTLGFAIQSSVFEIKDEQPALVGIVAAKMKTAYQVDPGKHLFMVVGESADFMSAELEADKTYYALVTPRMGLWKARFSLRAVHENELGSKEYNEWLNSCSWVEKNTESDAWADKNGNSIQSLQSEYYVKWMEKAANERPHLAPQDGE